MGQLVVNPDIWKGRNVFLTGHTGFKGAWLSLWLSNMGACVHGYSVDHPTNPSLFEAAGIADVVTHREGDIRNRQKLIEALRAADASVVIHMAAQSLVLPSYQDPGQTFETNVMGTVNVLEAVRQVGGIDAVLIITSDKCYENKEWVWGYREVDPMGGHDPYSASKGCAELVTASFRSSFFNNIQAASRNVSVASVRAGNVIGGGDWAENRLVPDLVRAAIFQGTATIRNPNAIRPWQFVLDPLAGYLILIQKMLEDAEKYGDAWNFGPMHGNIQPVGSLVEIFSKEWPGQISWSFDEVPGQSHEAHYLRLDCTKSLSGLPWRPVCDLTTTLKMAAEWYYKYWKGNDMRGVSLEQIRDYENGKSGSSWMSAE